jgi:translation elongation factor EF-1beta
MSSVKTNLPVATFLERREEVHRERSQKSRKRRLEVAMSLKQIQFEHNAAKKYDQNIYSKETDNNAFKEKIKQKGISEVNLDCNNDNSEVAFKKHLNIEIDLKLEDRECSEENGKNKGNDINNSYTENGDTEMVSEFGGNLKEKQNEINKKVPDCKNNRNKILLNKEVNEYNDESIKAQ